MSAYENMRKIALTGGIACGKSLVSGFLREFGVEIIDADDVVHEILPDPAERRRIAAEVFADSEKRKVLEERIHPQVKARIEAFFSSPASPGVLRLAVVPLLFESGWNADYDVVVCVSSSRDAQIARMMERRGYSLAEAEARIAAQWPVAEKAARADFTISNDGTPAQLRAKVEQLVCQLRAECERKGK